MVCHKHNIDPCSKCQTRLHYGGIIAGCVNEGGIASFQFPSHSSAQHGNIVHRRLERLRVGIVVVLVDEVDSFEPAKIIERLFHGESETLAELIDENHCPIQFIIVAVFHFLLTLLVSCLY